MKIKLLTKMDPRYAGETQKHLEKEYELLMEVYNSMSHELHTLQVEEEMLMRKFYELMTARGQTESKAADNDGMNNQQEGAERALVSDSVRSDEQ
nr:uncharacterized protein LOC109160900 isoform X2 [Ipomoea batatas]